MKHIIQFYIHKGDNQYVGEGVNLPIITQGKTIDEVVKNIKEAVELHLEGENLSEIGLAKNPSVLVNFELEPEYAKN